MTDTRGSTATPGARPPRLRRPRRDRPGLFARLGLFYRQVVAELRKVIWPTRSELITYTSVVLVFVAAVTIVVSVPRLRSSARRPSCSVASAT